MKRLKPHLLAYTALSASLWTIAPAFSQTPPPPAPVIEPRANAQEEITERIQRGIDAQQETLESQEEAKQIDGDKAADELEESTDKKEISSGILAKLPSFDNMEKLAEKMRREPNNLDHYFAYAQMADALGEYEKAAQTYEQMLVLAPNLDRIRLDLGAIYLRLGRFEEAKKQLEMVLQKDIPENVRPNVEKVLAQVESALKEHDFTGVISTGTNYDSNGNSAPESGAILIFDTITELSGDQLEQDDLQFFVAGGLNHSYRPRWAQDEAFSRKWKTSANYYRTKQSSLESLNIQVFSLKTGPEFRSNMSGITVHPSIARNQIILAEQTYLRTTTLDTTIDYPVNDRLLLSGSASHEFREFENSTDVSTYEDRTGTADQFRASARYLLDERNIINASVTHRRVRTRQEYFDNEQIGGTLSHTLVLPENFFLTTSVGYKNTTYDGADTLISTQTRHDKERTFGLTLGHQLADQLIASLGYQYRNTESNIPNYEYDNHRVSASVSYSF